AEGTRVSRAVAAAPPRDAHCRRDSARARDPAGTDVARDPLAGEPRTAVDHLPHQSTRQAQDRRVAHARRAAGVAGSSGHSLASHCGIVVEAAGRGTRESASPAGTRPGTAQDASAINTFRREPCTFREIAKRTRLAAKQKSLPIPTDD